MSNDKFPVGSSFVLLFSNFYSNTFSNFMLRIGDFKARWVDFYELCGGLFYSSACFVPRFGE